MYIYTSPSNSRRFLLLMKNQWLRTNVSSPVPQVVSLRDAARQVHVRDPDMEAPWAAEEVSMGVLSHGCTPSHHPNFNGIFHYKPSKSSIFVGVPPNIPKSSISIVGFSITNHPFGGTPINGNPHLILPNINGIFHYKPSKFRGTPIHGKPLICVRNTEEHDGNLH